MSSCISNFLTSLNIPDTYQKIFWGSTCVASSASNWVLGSPLFSSSEENPITTQEVVFRTTITALSSVIMVYSCKKFFTLSSKKPFSRTETDETFWQKIISTKSHMKEGMPVVIRGNRVHPNSTLLRDQMFFESNKRSKLVEKFSPLLSQKKILDLGCGTGPNSIPLLLRGARVVAIDNSKNLLAIFERNVPKLFRKNLTLLEKDITTCEYTQKEKEFDAVLCIDALPYLKPSTLQNTMKKIHRSLKPNGKFLGTLFFYPTFSSTPLEKLKFLFSPSLKIMKDFQEQLGVHYYPGKSCARELLERSRFKVIQYNERRVKPHYPSMCIEFLAEKI